MNSIIIIGGGAAGMMAACTATLETQANVILIEKNDKLGKKLYITGKGRCNLTNMKEPEEYMDNISGNPYFLYSSLYGFTPQNTIDFFEGLGMKTKIERGGRVFPASDKSSDVINAFKRCLEKRGVDILLNSSSCEVLTEQGNITGVKLHNGKILNSNSVVLATGGLSYPATGSTGDGYKFAQKLGHSITHLRPSLVPVTTKESFVKDLQGLSLKNTRIKLMSGKKTIYSDFGEMLFTHKGVSGPVILSASRFISDTDKVDYTLHIDLKPALSVSELDERILRDFDKYANKDYKNALDDLLPQKIIPVIITLSEIGPDKKVHSITKEERKKLGKLLKNFTLTVSGLGGYDEAVITVGGVCVDEINSSTMESKIIKGLYFAGELIDVDGFTGGFNLQIAFSTGFLAGKNAAKNTN